MAPNPGASTRVLTEKLVRLGIGYPGTANQIPQASAQIEEIFKEESIDIGELIELASANSTG
jgi:hypothetical protein